jgi:hypothetical protein
LLTLKNKTKIPAWVKQQEIKKIFPNNFVIAEKGCGHRLTSLQLIMSDITLGENLS